MLNTQQILLVIAEFITESNDPAAKAYGSEIMSRILKRDGDERRARFEQRLKDSESRMLAEFRLDKFVNADQGLRVGDNSEYDAYRNGVLDPRD